MVLAAGLLVALPGVALGFTPSGLLEIHHVNVQQGDCTLIIGPDGTTLLVDGGNAGKGTNEVVPYLQGLGLLPSDGLDYMLATHRDSDHLGGLDEVIGAGYDVRLAVWDNGSDVTGTQVSQFLNAAAGTTAGAVQAMPLGTVLALGGGATARCVAVGGEVLGHGVVSGAANNENDLSVALLVQYGGFDYITAGDLGGGQWSVDNNCTGRTTSQVNVETPLAVALMPGGGAALLGPDGVEVLDVNHHGSESSTNHEYMNLLSPRLAVINVGAGQGSTYHHPRHDVVENVLMAQAACITAPPALVLQTEEGAPTGANTSFAGYCAGDVVVKTAGAGSFEVSATGQVSQGPDERVAAGVEPPADFPFDGAGDTQPPVVTVAAPNGAESWTAGTTHDITWSASDNVGVTGIDVYYSTTGAAGPFTAIVTGTANDGVHAWLVPDSPTTDAFVKVVAHDAAGLTGEDLSDAAFEIQAAPALALHVHGLTVTNVSAGGNRWFGRASVTVHDQDHAAAASAVVTGDWSGIAPQTGDTGTTNGSGVATLESARKKNPSGAFCFDVTNLAKSGYLYASGSDVPPTPPAVCGPVLGGASLVAAGGLVVLRRDGPGTEVRFELLRAAPVRLVLYDVAGREVARIVDGERGPGTHVVDWNPGGLASGVYFYRFVVPGFEARGKLALVR